MSNDSKNIRNYSAEDIRRYWNNEMSTQEMHALEMAAMDDPFLADALEGYSKMPKDPTDDLGMLRKKLIERTAAAAVVPMKRRHNRWRIAAVLILLAGLGALTYTMMTEKQSSLAKRENRKDFSPPSASTSDTVKKVKDEVANESTSPGDLEKKSDNFTLVEKKQGKSGAGDLKIIPPRSDSFSNGLARKAVADDAYKSATAPVVSPKAKAETKDSNYADALEARAYREVSPPVNMQQSLLFNNFSGQVVDAQNRSIPSATVRMNNANQITATDQNGFFQFKSRDTIAEISIASVGYEEKYLTLNSNQSGLITLDPISKNKLNEVVVKDAYSKKANAKSDLKVYIMDAEPVIGWDKYNQYLDSNRKVSTADAYASASGEVVLSFKVNQKGELSSFEVEKSLNKALDNEAIRLVKQGPAWRVTKGKKAKVKLIVRF